MLKTKIYNLDNALSNCVEANHILNDNIVSILEEFGEISISLKTSDYGIFKIGDKWFQVVYKEEAICIYDRSELQWYYLYSAEEFLDKIKELIKIYGGKK